MGIAPFSASNIDVAASPRKSAPVARELRKTKIICTLGPASGSVERITALARAGMNIARINMSHGDKPAQLDLLHKAQTVSRALPHPIATLIDLKGPEIRTADRTDSVSVRAGELCFVSGNGTREGLTIEVDYLDIARDLKAGDAIHIDNGLIQLQVVEKTRDGLRCRALSGGMLGSRRHVNLPGVCVRLPPLTDQDIEDITFAAKHGADFVALSFVRSAEAVLQARALLKQLGASKIQIVSKIENAEGVDRFDEIVAVSDAVMVARGDLGSEIPYSSVPRVQRMIARRCSESGKPFIVATQILESMITRPIPTRAEVGDVANAVSEQADAIMLSGETATGEYPVRCVEVLDETARESEQEVGLDLHRTRKPGNLKEQLAWGACRLADTSGARAVVVMTRSGDLGRLVASYRPNAPVFAFTPDERAMGKLSLSRGILPFVLPLSPDPEVNHSRAFEMLYSQGYLAPSDAVVVVSNAPAGDKRVSAIQLREFG